MLQRWIVLLAFAVPTCACADPAGYRWQALISTDHKADTGCPVSVDGRIEHGIDARVIALSDRTRINSVALEFCEAGQWQLREVQQVGLEHRLDLVGSGTDRVEWSIARNHFDRYAQLSLSISAERLDKPGLDRLGIDARFTALHLALGAPPRPVPLAGAFLLFACILTAGALSVRRSQTTTLIPALVLPLILLIGPGSSRVTADPVRTGHAAAHDQLNDSLGQDAGVDIARAEVSMDGGHIRFGIEVNNIQDNALSEGARVLFVGNSLTYYNELPLMLQAVAAQAGMPIEVHAVTIGGASLQDHFRDRTALAEIARGRYQLVIMQQGPSSLAESQEHLREWSLRFATEIRASGARPALYMVWPERARFAYFGAVHESYRNAAVAVEGMLIPAGQTWLEAWQIDPQLALYGPDEFHPSPLGSYAAALSMFCALFRQSPTGLPADLSLADGQLLQFAPGQARPLQQSAWQSHLLYGIGGR
jgi:hypothetical protein